MKSKQSKKTISGLRILFAVTVVLSTMAVNAQKYVTKTGTIRFFSEAPLEKIEAINNQVNCALSAETGDMVFKVLMKSFQFEKALMQEHFNENYVESDKYPASLFKGRIVNNDEVDYSRPGEYEVHIEGDLTIHGETNFVSEKGRFTITDDGNVAGFAVFFVKLEDYKIKIPSAVVDNIAEEIEITVDVNMNKLNTDS